jgi:FtsZ-interacting cell division protein ZipA
MFGTALLIVVGLVIVGLCILALKTRRRRRIDRARSAPEAAVRERADNLRQLSRDMDKVNVSRVRQDALSVFGP